MLDTNKEILITSILATLFLFFAHALPINEIIIEGNIVNSNTILDKIIAYIIAFLYYVVVLFTCFYIVRRVKKYI